MRSFGINPGGYIGFYNPKTRQHETFALKADARARQRLAIKSKAQLTRRSIRYKLGVSYPERIESMVEFVQASNAWYEEVRRLPQAILVKLLKLGAKVARLIPSRS